MAEYLIIFFFLDIIKLSLRQILYFNLLKVANLENYSAETTEKVQNTQNSKFDFQSRNSTISAAVEAWNREHNQASQEADDLLNSIDNPQEPDGGKVVDVSTLDPEFVEERKNELLDDFSRWIQDLLGRGNISGSTKQEIAERTVNLFGPWWMVIYNGQPIMVKDLYGKIKDGTFNVDWHNVDSLLSNARVNVCRFAQIIELATPEGIKYIPSIRLQSISIRDKK